MGRGIFSGLFWGSIVALMALLMFSQLGGMIQLLAPPPAEMAQDVAELDAPDADEADESQPVATPVADDAIETSVIDATPSVTPDQQPTADTTTAATPQTTSDAPDVGLPDANVIDAAPELTVSDVVQPEVGTTTTLLDVSPDASPVQPTQTPAPSGLVVIDVTPVAPDLQQGDTSAPQVSQEATPELVLPGEPDAPAPETLPSSETFAAAEPLPEPPVTQPEVVETLPDPVDEQPGVESEAVKEPLPVEPDVAVEETVVQPDVSAAQPAQPALQPEVAEPEADDVEQTQTEAEESATPSVVVKVNRLPTIGGDQEEEVALPEEPEVAGEVVLTGRAIDDFAVPFENPNGLPVMAVILIDEGGARLDLASLPFPVSFVVDASRADAKSAMEFYRNAGREVVAMMPIPDRATPSDVEVAFQAYMNAMPEAVAVMDTRAANFQAGRLVATQVAEILEQTGHGLITYSRGLNSAEQVAQNKGVPVKLVFREIDNDGQNSSAIQRFLDRASFGAGQQSGVVMVGHNRPETIAALLEWRLTNRADTVALAPISVALQER